MNTISSSLSGLLAATKQLRVSASNIANVSTLGALGEGDPKPYAPLAVDVQSRSDGVVSKVVARDEPFIPVFAPDSPLADKEGLVGAPNINIGEELVHAKRAEHAYKASAALIATSKDLHEELINVLDEDV